MSKRSLVCILLIAVNILCLGILCVSATTPQENPLQEDPIPTQGVTTPAVPTVPVTDPVSSMGPTVPATSVPSTVPPTEAVTSTPTTTSPISSQPDTDVPATEVPQDNSGGNSSAGVNPNIIYSADDNIEPSQVFVTINPEDIDKIEQEAEQIKIMIENGENSNVGFGFDKSKASLKDDQDSSFFWVSILCWGVALALITFAVLFRLGKDTEDKGFAKETVVSAKGSRYAQNGKKLKKTANDDTYNDGF